MKEISIALVILIGISEEAVGNQCSKVTLDGWCSTHHIQSVARVYLTCNRDFTFHETRCRVNEQGHYCGLFTDYLDDINQAMNACLNGNMTSCSPLCQERLEAVKARIGCCINQILNTTVGPFRFRALFEYSLWNTCGIDTPPEGCPRLKLINATDPTKFRDCSYQQLIKRHSRVHCRESRLKSLMDEYTSNGCPLISTDYLKTCGISEDGKWCVQKVEENLSQYANLSKEAVKHCSSEAPCSKRCQRVLKQIKSNLGCCSYAVFNNTFIQSLYPDVARDSGLPPYNVWEKCGVVPPGSCQVTMYNSGAMNKQLAWPVIIFSLLQIIHG